MEVGVVPVHELSDLCGYRWAASTLLKDTHMRMHTHCDLKLASLNPRRGTTTCRQKEKIPEYLR